MLRIRQIAVMAVLTSAETLRQPVCLLLIGLGVVLTIITPLLSAYNFGEGQRLARDSGLAFQLIFGLLLAGYSSCSVIERERESGTSAAVLSKPVSREAFFFAKYCGVSTVVLLGAVCFAAATMLAERIAIRYTPADGFLTDFRLAVVALLSVPLACGFGALMNYRYRKSFQASTLRALVLLLVALTVLCGFVSRAGEWQSYHSDINWQILPAAAVVALGMLVLAAIDLVLAIRLKLPAVIFITLGLLVIGLVSDYFFGQSSSRAVAIAYRLLPDWQNFWVADMLADSGRVAPAYLLRVALYSICYTGGVLLLGMALFRRAEMT